MELVPFSPILGRLYTQQPEVWLRPVSECESSGFPGELLTKQAELRLKLLSAYELGGFLRAARQAAGTQA